MAATTFWKLFWLGVLLSVITAAGCAVGYGLAKPDEPEATAKPVKMDVHLLSYGNSTAAMVYTDVEVNLTSVYLHSAWLEYGVLEAYLMWGSWRVTRTVTLQPPPPSQKQTWTFKLQGAAAPIGPEGAPLSTDMVELVVRSSVEYRMRVIFVKRGRSTVNFVCPLQPAGVPCSVWYG